jgi:hypothetical protein
MKYIKLLGLLAVAAAALMAFAGTASATLTNADGTSPKTIHGNASGLTSLTGTVNVSCEKSTFGVEIQTNDANEASGPLYGLTYELCGSHTVDILQKGTFKVTDSDATTGTVTSNGWEVTVLTHGPFIGTVHCIYRTTDTVTGTFTESHHNPGTGAHQTATLHIPPISVERVSTSFGCGSHSTWEGTYEFTSPDTLVLD